MYNVSTFLNLIRAFIVKERPPFKDAEGLHSTGKALFLGRRDPPLPPHSALEGKGWKRAEAACGCFQTAESGRLTVPQV